MSEDKTYNGWVNYETWCVNLWLDNEQSSERYWRSVAQECYDEARNSLSANARLTGHEPFSQEERAAFAMANRLKSEVEESAPDLGASMWGDLLNAALSEVRWDEIAKSWIDSCDKTEPEEDDEE